MEQLVDNIIEMNHYITEKLKQTPGFKLVLPQFEGSTISFWYVKKSLSDSVKRYTSSQVHEICPNIKEKMIKVGTMMINYQPLTCKGLPNFFRLSLTCIPAPSKDDMDFVIHEIVSLAESNSL
jgi:glutamate decarboxylase-like protein 1